MFGVDEIIKLLKLEKHPVEGGYYLETYRAKEKIPEEYRKKINSFMSRQKPVQTDFRRFGIAKKSPNKQHSTVSAKKTS